MSFFNTLKKAFYMHRFSICNRHRYIRCIQGMTDFFNSDHISPETIFVHKELIRIEDDLRNKDNIPPNYPMMIFWAIAFAFGVLIGMNAYAQFIKLITILHESGDSVY